MYYKDFLEQFADDPDEYAEWDRWFSEAFAFWYKCRIYWGLDIKITTSYGEPIELVKLEDSQNECDYDNK